MCSRYFHWQCAFKTAVAIVISLNVVTEYYKQFTRDLNIFGILKIIP